MDDQYEQDPVAHLAANNIEVAILGASMLDEDALADMLDACDLTDFFLDSHRRIFAAVKRLVAAGSGVAFDLIVTELRRTRELDAIGGPSYLAFLTEGIPRNLHTESHIKVLKEKAMLREAYQIAERAKAEIMDGPERAVDAIGKQIAELQALTETSRDTGMEHFGTYITSKNADDPDRVFNKTAIINGVRTGFPQFDDMTSTLQNGDLWIVAARASMGKTAWATSLINQAVMRIDPTYIGAFFLEQSKTSSEGRLLCGRAEASFKRYRDGKLEEKEKSRIREAMEDFGNAPLFWCGEPSLTVSEISAKCRRMMREQTTKNRRGLDLVIVDQLSFLSGDDVYRKGMRGDEIVGAIVKALKNMAKKLDVPVILLAQISRAAVKNKDSMPTMADLAESGKIEQHADGVLLLHRPEYYDRSDASLHNKGQMIIAKQRDGPTGTIDVQYIKESCKWWDEKGSARNIDRIDFSRQGMDYADWMNQPGDAY